MSRTASDLPESDRLADFPHPRETEVLYGQGAAEAALLAAYRSNRMPHAVILGGPEGVGKATLAYRFARFVFAHPDPAAASVQAATNLQVASHLPAARQVAAGSHPNLQVLRREPDTKSGKMRTGISVDDTRRVRDFFTLKPATPGWRVLIVDPADDLNPSSSNALLKLVEEPPNRSLILIVSHAPQRLLPTIRSRCRLLRLPPLDASALRRILADLGVDAADMADALAHADGSVRRAVALLEEEARLSYEIVDLHVRDGGAFDLLRALQLADRIQAGRRGDALAHFTDAVSTALAAILRDNRDLPARRLAPVAELWNKLYRSQGEIEAFNVDSRHFVIETLRDLSALPLRAGGNRSGRAHS
jgi:DNA polymerase-3 subunit delta'